MSKTITPIMQTGQVAAGTPNGTPMNPQLSASLAKSQKKRKQRRNILIIAGGVVLVLAIIGIASSGKEKPITVQTEKVSRHTITEVVQATGKIQPEVQVKVSPEVPGEIIQLPFKEGDHIKKGDLLAKIKPTTFEDQYRGAEAQLNASKADAERSRAALIQADQNLKRGKKLLEQHLISEQDYDALKATYDQSEAAVNAAKYQIASSESQMHQYSEALRKTSVVSPMNGVVTSLNSQLGEKVVGTSSFAGTEMMTVSDLTVMNAMVDVDENDVVNIKLGDNVKISIDAFPKQIFTGKVIEIANSAKLAGAGSQDQSTNFTVKVRLDDFGTSDLRPGMTCTARIETQTKENVLAVPLLSVTRRDNEDAQAADSIKKVRQANKGTFHEGDENPTVVFTVDKSGVAKLVHVRTGISDNAYVEVLDGLKGDEEVVKGNFRAVSKDLEDKKKVKVDNTGKAQ
jgi:HlyD family secretion protein